MQVTGNKISPKINIRDGAQHARAALDLFVLIGDNYFQYCTYDFKLDKFGSLVDYHEDSYIPLTALGSIIQEDEILQQENYRKIKIGILNDRSTLVPAELHSNDSIADVHKLNYPTDSFSTIYSDHLQALDAENIYDCKNGLKALLKEHFEGASFFHFSTPLIERVLLLHKNSEEKVITANVFSHSFQLLVSSKQQLHFYNSFKYQTSEEFIYYILYICDQLQLNPDTVRLELAGSIFKTDGKYTLARKFVRNVEFVDMPGNFYHQFNKIPLHQYFVLFNEQLCA